jgi:beta-N-acetylhexosaminidase
MGAHVVWAMLLMILIAPERARGVQAADAQVAARAEALLSTMTPEQKVGQLFIVAFTGSDPSPGTDIAQLIQQDHIGGVVLLAANSNLINREDTPRHVADLANGLQALAMESGAQLPLFIAIDHEGDGYPFTRITGGTTPLPNAMAIGATWDPDKARSVGKITGREMAAMGLNLLLGPSVDVLTNPRPSGQGDIGTRTFGGDPWWVGQMGQAYIEGVHEGSGGRVATVAKHFPGHGGSDRLPDEEVATVDKSLAELMRVELAPFLAVVEGNGRSGAVTDGLMSSHIRYRGLQGEIRQLTAPISFDPNGMQVLLALEGFVAWRPTGLMVSDSLGVPAVRKYFDPTLATFPHRRIAKEALLAGNDLLLLAQFDLNNVWEDQRRNIRDTIAFFRDEYWTNPAFANRVDQAVARTLRHKLRLYPELALEAVQVHPEAALQVCGLGEAVTQEIANEALTLLYPEANAVPAPPHRGERLLVFTDARSVRECFTEACQPFAPLSQTAVEEAIIRIYGPDGSAQIDPDSITSLPFGQLKAFLTGSEVQYDVDAHLQEADWIVFAQQDLNPLKGPNSDAVKLFLDHRQSTTYDARLVVLAFNAPYYLDTTEISKLDLYLAAYSKTQPFVEAAVRALFRELDPQGAPPVDVAGINYDLARQLSPDPDQVIPLVQVEPIPGSDLYPTMTVRLEAGPVLDRNGHPVPDGTQLTFYAEPHDRATGGISYSGTTLQGLGQMTLTLHDPGAIRLRVESGDARRSQVVELDVQPRPTETPTETPTPTPVPTTQTPVASPTASPLPPPDSVREALPSTGDPVRSVDGFDLALAIGTVFLIAGGGYPLLISHRKGRSRVMRWALVALIGGMGAYICYAMQWIRPETWLSLPSAPWIARAAVIAVTAVGAALPLPIVVKRANSRMPRR